MARLPKDPDEAVGLLRIADGAAVLVVGPAAGYVEAIASSVGRCVVQDPPPDLDAASVTVVDALPTETFDAVVVWLGSVALHELDGYTAAVGDGGTLHVLLHAGTREFRAQVTEGEVKRYLLPLGWRQAGGAVRLEKDLVAVRYVRR